MMIEFYSSPFTNSASAVLGQSTITGLLPEFENKFETKSKNNIQRSKLKECAESFYDLMMRSCAKMLFDSLGANAAKKPMHQYSAAIKALTVCSIYLIAVENSRIKQVPQWLIAFLLEAIRFGDKLECELMGSDIIASFGSHPRGQLIEAVTDLALTYIDCDIESVRRAILAKLDHGVEERFALMEKALPKFPS